MTARRWARRLVLGLCLFALAGIEHPSTAAAAPVSVGDLTFTVPVTISERSTSPSTGLGQVAQISFGDGWQWVGHTAATGPLPSTVVLARTDLAAIDAGELLGLVLAGSATGMLPDLRLTNPRIRPMPGSGEQTRIGIEYSTGAGVIYHGELLIATRPTPPAALLVVLGNEDLTAATVDSILESARWRS
jgi:hypothetical protein